MTERPNELVPHRKTRQVGDLSVDAGRGAGQLGWYRFAAELVAGHSVIDIGCGLGRGLELLKASASSARGQDLDERLASPDVYIGPVSGIPTRSADFVTCVDVIEHVEDDKAFLLDLTRIARIGVFITTPLSVLWREIWPYHVREYTFQQFADLTASAGSCEYFKGSPSGDVVLPITNVSGFRKFQRLFNHPVTNLPVRALQKLLPGHLRNMAHQAVLVKVGASQGP